jgi:hypothetical protein
MTMTGAAWTGGSADLSRERERRGLSGRETEDVRLEVDGGGGEASAGGDKFLSTCWASPISISDDIACDWLVFQENKRA